ncbi:hypothetical protein [Enterovibrio coralii]|uniref:Uncharacterized protein n=1 Tax=Enterovibrio coralii TaxID=294935 RepID=A0A135ICA4_9GAMM|nr:hypothetical protein [Enterovibrio coralii]KXF82974.1 hypothetical protein ATN88_04270 [Enterovibrio coralii]
MTNRGEWFTIVATDLFAASFAAILIIDAASPKELFVEPSDSYFELNYPLLDSERGSIPCERNDIAIAFSFLDDDGVYQHSLSGEAAVTAVAEGSNCIVRGLFLNVPIATAPREPLILIVEYPGSEDLEPSSIRVLYNQTEFLCSAEGECK